jgi:hypothetical protein
MITPSDQPESDAILALIERGPTPHNLQRQTLNMRRHRFRFTTRRMMILVTLLCLVFGVLRRLSYMRPSLGDRLLALMLGQDTEYPDGFSEEKWNKIRAGMTTSEVESIMGPPFNKLRYPGQFENWKYSASHRNSHHWNRTIQFRRGRVVEIHHSFYVD